MRFSTAVIVGHQAEVLVNHHDAGGERIGGTGPD